MTRAFRRSAAAVILAAILAMPASAWGPRTQLAMCTTAAHMISKEGPTQLLKLIDDIVNGTAASTRILSAHDPDFAQRRPQTIAAQMFLLQAVRGKRIDPYFAFRLGVLGKLVADTVAPMADGKSHYRDLYYADVDDYIDRVPLPQGALRPIDPATYFDRLTAMARDRGELYESDYRQGLGFQGVAKASLEDDAARSVKAIADVWFTVLTQRVLQANLPAAAIEDYVVDAMRYYVERGKEGLLEQDYDRLSGLTAGTAKLHERLGDMFFESGQPERGVRAYQRVLELDPSRRAVAAKIAAYYEEQGDQALESEQLEDAYDAYAKAIETNPLHAETEGKRLEAQKLIREREARLDATKAAIAAANELTADADRELVQQRFARAIVLLREAENYLSLVTDEFPPQKNMADSALRQVKVQIRRAMDQMAVGAEKYSGTGFYAGLKDGFAQALPGLEQDAFEALLEQQYEAENGRLREALPGRIHFD